MRTFVEGPQGTWLYLVLSTDYEGAALPREGGVVRALSHIPPPAGTPLKSVVWGRKPTLAAVFFPTCACTFDSQITEQILLKLIPLRKLIQA